MQIYEPDALRFGVGSTAFGYSFVWRVWHAKNKSDVFVAARMAAGVSKVSLHESGACHIGFTHGQMKKGEIDRSIRHWKRWRRPDPHDDVSIPFRLIIPIPSLSKSMPRELGTKDNPVTWIEPVPLPGPPGTVPAIEVAFSFLYRRITDPMELTRRFPNGSMPVGGIHDLPNGQDLLVVLYPTHTNFHLQRVNPVNRTPLFKADIALPSTRGLTPYARGITIGELSDGSVWVCEFDAPAHLADST